MPLHLQVPARVAALLGWNQLTAGESTDAETTDARRPSNDAPDPAEVKLEPGQVWAPVLKVEPQRPRGEAELPAEPTAPGAASEPSRPLTQSAPKTYVNPRARKLERQALRSELEDLAAEHDFPGVTRLDGRGAGTVSIEPVSCRIPYDLEALSAPIALTVTLAQDDSCTEKGGRQQVAFNLRRRSNCSWPIRTIFPSSAKVWKPGISGGGRTPRFVLTLAGRISVANCSAGWTSAVWI